MAHHKRHKRKDLRAGCFCKLWKSNAFKDTEESKTYQEKMADLNEVDDNPSFEEIEREIEEWAKDDSVRSWCECNGCVTYRKAYGEDRAELVRLSKELDFEYSGQE